MPGHDNKSHDAEVGDFVAPWTAPSQEELAHRAGIDRSYASSVERGRQNPGIVLVLQIAAALEVSASELLERAKL